METIYTGWKAHRHNGVVHWAEVDVRGEPCGGPTEVVLSDSVLSTLRGVFGADFEHNRHCTWSGVAAQIGMADIAGEMPRAKAARFRVEVVGVPLSGNAGVQVSGSLLTAAGMDASDKLLSAWESPS